MYTKERTHRKQIRIKDSVLKAAKEICDSQHRNLTNLIEALILEEYKAMKK